MKCVKNFLVSQLSLEVIQMSLDKRSNPFIADDGTDVWSFEDLQARNRFHAVTDGADIQGSIYEMLGNVDLDRLRSLEIPAGLEDRIRFYQANASSVAVINGGEADSDIAQLKKQASK